MGFAVPFALLGWPIVVLALFATMAPRRAVITAMITGWLFLPIASYDLPGFTSYNKTNAITLSVTLGILAFDTGRLLIFRPSWLDLSIVIWCGSAALASLANGLGVNDAGSSFVTQVTHWGLPYLFGRLYFSDHDSLKALAVGIFAGGLVYVPFCLWEINVSPRLHLQVYGFRQHEIVQTRRGDGYRPMVFMQHGLMVSMWMAMASLVGIWLAWSEAYRRLWGQSVWLHSGGLFVTAVLCKSAGAVGLLLGGMAVVVSLKLLRLRIVVILLALMPVIYIAGRGSGAYDGSRLIDVVSLVFDKERVASLRYRMEAEDILSEHARKRPWIGWGGWSRNRPAEMGVEGVRNVATDGFWIIAFGKQGLLGLMAAYCMLLLPAGVLVFRLRAVDWTCSAAAPAGCLAVVLLLYAVDNLFNAMINPVFTMASGGLMGFVTKDRASVGVRLRKVNLAPV